MQWHLAVRVRVSAVAGLDGSILKRHSTGSNNWVIESSDNSGREFDICDRSLHEVGERYEETRKEEGQKRNW